MSSFRVVYLIKYKKHKSAKTLIPQGFWCFLISRTNFIEIIIFIDFHIFLYSTWTKCVQNVCKYMNRISLLLHRLFKPILNYEIYMRNQHFFLLAPGQFPDIQPRHSCTVAGYINSIKFFVFFFLFSPSIPTK